MIYFRTEVFTFNCGAMLLLSLLPPTADGGAGSLAAGFLAGNILRGWLNNPADDRFTKAIGSKLETLPGETVVMSLYAPSRTVKRPWHWFYVIAPGKLLRFQPHSSHMFQYVMPKIFDPAVRYPDFVLMNRQKKPGHIGLVGSLLGYMMVNHKLYFHPFFCSAKHYVEYLSLGVVKGGHWYQPLYNRLSRKCPVREHVTPDMIHSIFQSKTFTMRAKNQKYSVTLNVEKWPEEIVAMYQSYIAAAAAKQSV